MKQIDLEPNRVRFISSKAQVLADKAWRRAAIVAAVWFVMAVAFSRSTDHGLPWWAVALAAIAPGAILAFVAVSLDDGID